MLHLDHRRDDITVHVLAMLSVLLHFGNKEAQKQISIMTRQDHTQIFGRMHKILTTASTILLEERYPLATTEQLSPMTEISIILTAVTLNDLTMFFCICM